MFWAEEAVRGCEGPEVTVSGGLRNGKEAVWPERMSRGELGDLRLRCELWFYSEAKGTRIASLCNVKTRAEMLTEEKRLVGKALGRCDNKVR